MSVQQQVRESLARTPLRRPVERGANCRNSDLVKSTMRPVLHAGPLSTFVPGFQTVQVASWLK
jgi:hypothetical protein